MDQVFNNQVHENDLQHGNDAYRVYASFCDPWGNILINDDEIELAAWYEFEVTLP